ncbi:hypothetical protein R3P38DRAFT_3172183 [Favolaschia claudopus]|uniref:Uncharacterized protein n=1 Tax=Favolaschia claudopus TaxID=2862362 RepID=A0AAW0DKX3_9AGAR
MLLPAHFPATLPLVAPNHSLVFAFDTELRASAHSNFPSSASTARLDLLTDSYDERTDYVSQRICRDGNKTVPTLTSSPSTATRDQNCTQRASSKRPQPLRASSALDAATSIGAMGRRAAPRYLGTPAPARGKPKVRRRYLLRFRFLTHSNDAHADAGSLHTLYPRSPASNSPPIPCTSNHTAAALHSCAAPPNRGRFRNE